LNRPCLVFAAGRLGPQQREHGAQRSCNRRRRLTHQGTGHDRAAFSDDSSCTALGCGLRPCNKNDLWINYPASGPGTRGSWMCKALAIRTIPVETRSRRGLTLVLS
jgi:hypothetical protein